MRVDNADEQEENPQDRKRRQTRERVARHREKRRPVYAPGNRSARKWNPDNCPVGWDTVVWHLTLFFEQIGVGYGHKSNGRPIIYGLLEQRINASGIRTFVEHLPDREPADQPWVRLVQRMIQDYWDYDMNPQQPTAAVSEFTSAVYFIQQRDYIINKLLAEIQKEEMAEAKANGTTTCACHNRPAHENHQRISE